MYVVTLPTITHAACGLALLSDRQYRSTTNLHVTATPYTIPDSLRHQRLNNVPTITQRNVSKLAQAKDTCTSISLGFRDRPALSCVALFRAAAILTMIKNLTIVKHRNQNLTATGVDQLSPATHALLQALYAIKPVTKSVEDRRPSTAVFTPTALDYNPLRLHAQ
jgi:hypothetical protein